MFKSKNKKVIFTPANHSFTICKNGLACLHEHVRMLLYRDIPMMYIPVCAT